VKPRRSRALAAVAAVAFGVAGCGGHTATKQDVVARANAICFNAVQAVRSLAPPTSPSTQSDYLHKVLAVVDKEAADTRALPRPARDRAVLDRYVVAVSAVAAEYRTLAADAARNDAGAVSAGLAILRASPATSLARQYGLAQCTGSAATGVS
jgi:hypothetical protein